MQHLLVSTGLRSLYIGALMSVSAIAFAQPDIDSLRTVAYDPSRPDSVRFAAFYDMVWDGFLFNDPDSAFVLGSQLQRDARDRNNPVFVARASELLAAVWYVRGDMRTALLHYDTALAQHKLNRDDDGYADVITNMASMRSALGERDEALELYAEGLAVHERIKDSLSIANDLNAIGTVHMARGDHARAIDLYARSLKMHEAMKNHRGMATGRANLGVVHVNQGDFRNALIHFQEALRIAEAIDDRHLMGKDLEEVGACLEELGDTAAAMARYQRSLTIREALKDDHGSINVRNRIAQLLMFRGLRQQALSLFDRTVGLAIEQELPRGLAIALVGKGDALLAMGRRSEALVAAQEATKAASDAEDLSAQRDAAELECRAFRALGRWKEALEAQTLFISYNDSLVSEENQRAVLRNEYEYAYEKQAIADSLAHVAAVQQEAIKSEQHLAQERSRRNIALALGALFAVALFAFWQRARLLKRTNATILDAQAKLMESERGREAAEVRTRIARDVHDQLGSDLTKLALLSSEARMLAGEDPQALSTLAEDMERVAAEANRSLGDIVWAIDPHHDSLAGLTERVRAHCERMLIWSKVGHTIDCVHSGPDRSLDPATKRDIYLILREALNNAIKYSEANRIDVVLRSDESKLSMSVEDNGIGFDGSVDSGHGLDNMRQRAARIGASFSIRSKVGTRVALDLVLPA